MKAWWALSLIAVACVDDAEQMVRREQAEGHKKIDASNTTLAESDDVKVKVKFVAFGDVDWTDDTPLDMVPDVRIAIIKDDRVSDWWTSITGIQDYISPIDYIPPGVQVQSSIESISAAPASFITTGFDGTAETVLRFDNRSIDQYMICVSSPDNEDLIAGCSRIEIIWLPNFDTLSAIFYIYFSDGRAYIDRDKERYQRFSDKTLTSKNDSYSIAKVAFVSAAYSDIGPPVFRRNALVAIIKDEDIGDWWQLISDNRLYDSNEVPFLNKYEAIQFDSRVLNNMPIHIANTGYNAITRIELEPDDYLLCEVTQGLITNCIYEYIVSTQTYEYEISYLGEGGYYMERQSEGYVERLLRDSQDWEFIG